MIPLVHKIMLNQYRAELVALGKLSGITLDSVKKVSNLHETILCDSKAGIKLPNWVGEVYPDGLRNFAMAHPNMYTHTPFMVKRKSGALAKTSKLFLTKKKSNCKAIANLKFTPGTILY